jgi:hypothetical protein
MVRRAFPSLAIVVCTGTMAAVPILCGPSAIAGDVDPGLLVSSDPSGQLRTLNVNGELDLENPFFQDLGTNGRRCVSCHQPDNAWTITPGNVQMRFATSKGTDPIFRNNDGSNCEGVQPQSRSEKKAAYSLLLTRGLIRIGLDVPQGAEFAIDSVEDPNHCGAATNDASFYRRPLPSTNVSFLSAVMWDGRESSPTTTMRQDLMKQANDATRGHAQAAVDITAVEAQQIVDFQIGLFTAQARDRVAGSLSVRGATGGPIALSQQPFFVGINDPVGLNPSGAAFDPKAFGIFNLWAAHAGPRMDPVSDARRAIVRGEEIFNTKPNRPERRGRSQRGDLRQRRHPACILHRHLHDLSRLTQRRQPFGEGAAQHRAHRARYRPLPPGVHRAKRRDRSNDRDDGYRPSDDHGQVAGRRQVQGPDSAWARRARPVLPQRLRRDARRRDRVL